MQRTLQHTRFVLVWSLLLLCTTSLIACGDDEDNGDGSSTTTGETTSGTSTNTSGTTSTTGTTGNTTGGTTTGTTGSGSSYDLIVAASDFSETKLATVNLSEKSSTALDETFSGDVALTRVSPDTFAVLDRGATPPFARVFAFDDDVSELVTVELEEGSNPQDVAELPDGSHLITTYASADLIRLGTDNTTISTLSLSAVLGNDPDGAPEMTKIFVDEESNTAYIALQFFDTATFTNVSNGALAVVDLDSFTLVDQDPNTDGIEPFQLPNQNPFTFATSLAGNPVIALVAGFGDTEGEVVEFNPTTKEITTLFSEADVQGDILALAPTQIGWLVIVSTPDFTTNLLHVVGSNAEIILEGASFDFGAIAPSNDGLSYFLANTSADSAGVQVFTGQEFSADSLSESIPTTLPPRAILVP